ncbi:RAS protein activator like 1 (GAP1 like) (predicted) [Rattus norvegicus]|uniref:RAS protein activator like 1 n=3 Tax=Rattus norvegicus TaxID=10116 RepID=D3ZHY9_RAT|nr:rasGAP-activating-like protein 1 [Rattus norvegicus]XP_006249457.1 rasGAP-activating-like protein 1 isoform X1 [Rattus norvegicus]EDM13771.1 RAS protein activator like 1 (GAP1 like) (predicted) [Rattus norvegicus]|eukprot:NP_001101805.1 rasGAP-activating-like protein 1 [Rattus norvegicus]
MAKSGSLSIRVVEGRALPAKDVSGSSDPYCLVKVDDEVVARTATIWRSLSPFWGEEYTVHLPLDFHHLAFYVLDEDTVGHDDIIGKISLSKEAITADPRGIDSWINLSRVDPDEEVQGEVCLAVKLLEDARGRCLRCHVRQARDLAPRDISGTSDPFARVFWGSRSLETSTIKKTRFPHWDEVLELREAPGTTSPLRVELWDWDMVGKNDFLGMVEFTPQTLQQKPPNGWFRLLPFPRAEDSGGSLGALRLKVRLTEDRVLPSQYYQPLMELLLESVQGPAEEDTTSPLALLEELASGDCRQDLATKLVKLFLGRGLAGPFLDYLTRREVARTNDPNTLFRSNSLASKSMEQFMKLVGMRYLHEVLRPVISRVFEEKKYMELDPSKMDLNRSRRISFKGTPTEEQVRETSLGLLTGYLGSVVDAIVSSAGRCPLALRLAFKQLQQCVEKRFPGMEHQDVKYLATSGFLFLRFFAPAILTPKLFDLRDHHADPQTSRSLLLLAKAVQSIGNLGQQLGQGKEQWLAPLHPFLLQSISRVRDFLDQLVDVDGDEEAGGSTCALVQPSTIVREGFLLKRKEEPASLATRFAFKKRYFRLSGRDLSYSKTPEWQVHSSIPLSCIRAVERVDEGAFQLPHVMQVVTQDGTGASHTTYLQCKNVNDLNQWLSALRKASAPNPGKLAACHPGAFRSGRWTCCLQAERSAVGCSRTHSAVTLGDWSDPLDPDAEAQMVYRQLLLGRDQLRLKLLEDSSLDTAPDVDPGKDSSAVDGPCAEVLAQQREATTRLLQVLEDLEQAHEEFQKRG